MYYLFINYWICVFPRVGILFRLKTPTDLTNTWKSLTKMVLCTCRWSVQPRQSESNMLQTVDLCVFSSPAASRDTTHTGLAAHSHTGSTRAVSSAEQMCSEKLSERDHQHLLSPQSWIWVFSCSVSQENRADLPSSSSYFRSLTKCCKNRQVNSDPHSEQMTVWMVKEPSNT